MTESVDDRRLTWGHVSERQVLDAIDGQRLTNACRDCGGDGCFRLTDTGWKFFVEHVSLSCPHLRRVKAEAGGAG